MADQFTFKIQQGLVFLEKVYWSSSETDLIPATDEEVHLFGDKDRKNSVYLHINVSNLFTTTLNGNKVQKDTEIVVDLFSMDKDTAIKLLNSNDTENVKNCIATIGEVVLNLSPKGIDIKEDTLNEGVVGGLGKTHLPLKVTRLGSRKNSKGSYYHDLCFEFKLEEQLQKKIFDRAQKGTYLYAWAWTCNKNTIDEYKAGFNVDIVSQDNRIKFLNQGDDVFLNHLVDNFMNSQLVSNVTGIKPARARRIYGAASFIDNYPYDEPSTNYLKIEKGFPFKMFAIGSQLGPIGLHKKDDKYHRQYISCNIVANDYSIYKEGSKDSRMFDSAYYLDELNDKSMLPNHGLKSDYNEYFSAGDPFFIFKENSFAKWINSIEKQFNASVAAVGSGTIIKDNFPFDKERGKIELVVHDYLADYYTKFKDNALITNKPICEQKILDINKFASITIAPESELTDKSNKLIAKVGRGIPGHGFIGFCHNKVHMDGQKDRSFWETHTIAHRPLLIVYELERDLSKEEIEFLKNEPLKADLVFWQTVAPVTVQYALPIDLTSGIKAGKHLIAVYLDSNLYSVKVNIIASTIIPTMNRTGFYDNKGTLNGFSAAFKTDWEYTLYALENEGLFQENPVIIIDDFSKEERDATKIRKAVKSHNDKTKKASVSLLLSIIPKYGDVAAAGWEIGFDIFNGTKIEGNAYSDITKKALSALIKEYLGKKDPSKLFQTNKLAGQVLPIVSYLFKMNQLSQAMHETVKQTKSPFIQGRAFGDDDRDSLFLMAVTTRNITINKDTFKSAVSDPITDSVSLFMNREIVVESYDPFNIQFGETAGLLERSDYNQEDSVAVWRSGYLGKLGKLRDNLDKLKENGSVVEYLSKLVLNNAGQNLSTMLKGVGANKKLITYTESSEFSKSIDAKIRGSNVTEEDIVRFSAMLNLMKYIDAVFACCPACGNTVSLSWGWCPYHATAELLPQLKDRDGDGKLKEEFVRYLKNDFIEKRFNDPKISEILMDSQLNTNRGRLLVHWTEFLVKR
jgi:hypothetical protein